MLLDVVIAAEADNPAIGRLEPCTAVSVASNMRALNGSGETAGHAAMVLAHPGTMRRTLPSARFTRSLALKPVR